MNPASLLTDLYEFTMAAGYFVQGYNPRATFELFVRELPPRWNYLIAAGLEQALDFLKEWHFSNEAVSFLRTQPQLKEIPEDFFQMLLNLKFSGDVYGLPEGTFVFANEPLLRLQAPLIECQLLETYLLSMIGYQTLVATKTNRVAEAACGREVIDFGSRRAHGPFASLWGARAAFIGGTSGTSNVLAAQEFGIEAYGTMAHSWVMAFASEEEAFRRYGEVYKKNRVLLVDTYDCENAVHLACRFDNLKAIRIDSGDIAALSKKARAILDQAGRRDTKIMASGNLDEYKIAELLSKKAPIDFFGVGSSIITGGDVSNLNSAYKLVAIEEEGKAIRAVHKTSQGKATLPGIKQIWRVLDTHGEYAYDRMGLEGEVSNMGTPLLKCVTQSGEILKKLPSIHEAKQHVAKQKKLFPKLLFSIHQPYHFDVELSENLEGR